MGTRAAAFTAKIRNLHDFHVRLVHNIMPTPSGVDIANTLKHFSQTLLGVMKDVPNFPMVLLKSREQDNLRMSLFPSLDYKALFTALVQLLDVGALIQVGIEAFGLGIFHCLSCLMPFLEHELIDVLPYVVSYAMAALPPILHQEIVNMLCYRLFPVTLASGMESSNYASQSISAVIMMVLQYSNNTEQHCQLIECLMSLKQDLQKDLFCVIAYGTPKAQVSAANLLVYYWPHSNHHLYDRRGIQFKFSGWRNINCQWDQCANFNNIEAVKICLDHTLAVACANDPPPPLFVCQDCATKIFHGYSNSRHIYDLLQPMPLAAMSCENKNCRSIEKAALVVCFSTDCVVYNKNRPVHYCSECHAIRHNDQRGNDHMFHTYLEGPWDSNAESQNYIVEAIISLLKATESSFMRESGKEPIIEQRFRMFTESDHSSSDNISMEDRRLLGRYGIWLLVGLCTPTEKTPTEMLGRLLSMLFQWFNATTYHGTIIDLTGNVLEKLKTEYLCPWLMQVVKSHFDVFVSCLLPHPPEYTRVGGHWETLTTRTGHLKEGFVRLFCLVPYEIITLDLYTYIMPHWMEAMSKEVPEEDMPELKILLSKVMDADMNPLGLNPRQIYRFISLRFKQTTFQVQEQALMWLQLLSSLEITVPLDLLLSMFREGIRAVKSTRKHDKTTKRGVAQEEVEVIAAICPEDSRSSSAMSEEGGGERVGLQAEQEPDDKEHMLSCFILVLDVMLRELELQQIEIPTGLKSSFVDDLVILLKTMASAPWIGKHTCKEKDECNFCDNCVIWYQLAFEVIVMLSTPQSGPAQTLQGTNIGEEADSKLLSPDSDKKTDSKSSELSVASPKYEIPLGGVLANMPQVSQLLQLHRLLQQLW